MRKLAFAILLLAACGRKQEGPAPVTIAITRDGFVKWEGKEVTLDELATLLAARRAAAPLEEVAGDKASSLPVHLELEDDALWRHVQWVMVVLAEQKFWRLSLPGGRDAPLPCDSGGCISVPPDGKALLLHVLVGEEGDYAFGPRATRDIGEIGSWIDAVPRRGFLCRIGVIHVQKQAPWRHVRPVFDLLRDRGVKREFYGVQIPSREERARPQLPRPGPSPRPRVSSGAVPVDYWSALDYSGEEEPTLPGEDFLAWLDSHRHDAGASRLIPDDTLGKAASLHAEEMDRMGYFGHFSPVPGSRSPSDRLAKLGWPEERRHSEVLAKAESAEAAFAAVLAKPENEAILAEPEFRYVGVAQSGDYWVVLLGAEP